MSAADSLPPAAPQAFSFGGTQLVGNLVSFNGTITREGVTHRFLKRPGSRIEDMERAPFRLEVELFFPTKDGISAAKAFQTFAAQVDNNPVGQLVHPIAGQWQAFCRGTQARVNFRDAKDGIYVRVTFDETELDNFVTADVPGVATAGQAVDDAKSAHEVAISSYMEKLAEGAAIEQSALDSLQAALADVAVITAPMDFMRDTISNIFGAESAIFGTIDGIFTKAKLLSDDVQAFRDSATGFFDGGDSAGAAVETATRLGVVLQDAADLEQASIAAASTPAGAFASVDSTELLAASCLILDAAVKAARPPVVLVTVPQDTDLLSFCQHKYKTRAEERAEDIRALNKIENPAFIPSGTRLFVPAR